MYLLPCDVDEDDDDDHYNSLDYPSGDDTNVNFLIYKSKDIKLN